LWLEQQIIASSSTIDSELKMRMLRNITSEISSTQNSAKNVYSNMRLQFKKWVRVAAMFILPALSAAGMLFLYVEN